MRLFYTFITAVLLLSLSSGCSPKAKARRHLSLGDNYFDAGQYPKAEVEYLNTLRLDSKNSRAMGRLGTIYYEQGGFGRAYGFLARASELQATNLDLQLKMGTIYLILGKTKEAINKANLILGKMPTNAEAPLLLADCAATSTNLEAIRLRLEELSKQVGDTAPLQVALGTLNVREGNLKAAETAFKRAQTLDPQSAAAHYGLGTLWRVQN